MVLQFIEREHCTFEVVDREIDVSLRCNALALHVSPVQLRRFELNLPLRVLQIMSFHERELPVAEVHILLRVCLGNKVVTLPRIICRTPIEEAIRSLRLPTLHAFSLMSLIRIYRRCWTTYLRLLRIDGNESTNLAWVNKEAPIFLVQSTLIEQLSFCMHNEVITLASRRFGIRWKLIPWLHNCM